MLPDIAKDFHTSIPVAGHLISAYALGVVIGAPLLVAFTSNYAPKKILTALMIIFTVFNACSAFAPNHYFLLFSRLLAGLPHGAFFGVGSVVATRLADKGKQAQAISIMFLGLTIANGAFRHIYWPSLFLALHFRANSIYRPYNTGFYSVMATATSAQPHGKYQV
nr:MFS transporter [Mucilaginibacter sp. FT3.2]